MKDLSELVQAAQSGDGEAYNALVQRFQPMAYATAYRHLNDHHLAQDVVQEAIIEAFIHLSQLKEPAAFPGWFRQIVFRQCTRVLRQTTIASTSLETLGDDLLDDLLMESNPEDIALQREVLASVRSAIAALPQHERLVTVLFYGRCYSYNEVSTLLNIPLTTVKKRLHSARQKLKVQLKSALHEASEIARHTDDGAAAEEIRLAQCLLLRLKNVQIISVATSFSASDLSPILPICSAIRLDGDVIKNALAGYIALPVSNGIESVGDFI
ncbi:MAG TPA: sigma-70 family RNA polymerase sigma factor [Ktedonobacteraceae bacterium]|nr:sigma-70 family RNA polymerase sigma factor [Ktedonobacteraceae bacterium]